MTKPVEVPLHAQQASLFRDLSNDLQEAQQRLNVFCAAVFAGIGETSVNNVQVVQDATGPKLVGVTESKE
jgi:hypothetical protein